MALNDRSGATRYLKSIQVFEAVARFSSISLAAQDLNLSQGTVSYHIRTLEDGLDVKLFRRTAEGVLPTRAADILLPYVRDGLRQIHLGLQQVQSSTRDQAVKVAMPPMFASRWLAPRLGGFWEMHPEIQLSFVHDEGVSLLGSPLDNDVDVAVQWGHRRDVTQDAKLLFREPLVAACSPWLIGQGSLISPSDLRAFTLLHVDNHSMWEEWLRSAGQDPELFGDGLMMRDRHFQLSATLNGMGVSLFLRSFIEDEIETGKLVSPFQEHFETDFAYWLVRPTQMNKSANVTAFSQWLIGRAARKEESQDNVALEPAMEVS